MSFGQFYLGQKSGALINMASPNKGRLDLSTEVHHTFFVGKNVLSLILQALIALLDTKVFKKLKSYKDRKKFSKAKIIKTFFVNRDPNPNVLKFCRRWH